MLSDTKHLDHRALNLLALIEMETMRAEAIKKNIIDLSNEYVDLCKKLGIKNPELIIIKRIGIVPMRKLINLEHEISPVINFTLRVATSIICVMAGIMGGGDYQIVRVYT